MGGVDAALERLERYAARTGVAFRSSGRRAGWQSLGLPDLRGFTPQLRTVQLFHGTPARFPRPRRAEVGGGAVAADAAVLDVARGAARRRSAFEALAVDQLWLLHDLAHIAWYDMATATFGAHRWSERDFFLEHHLVSEAFAVLLLDYHLLARTRHRGLAVELDGRTWERWRTRVRGLPPLRSTKLVHELVRHYLAGDAPLFARPLRANAADRARLARWRDHEVSYSAKQRRYVLLWWDDLALAPPSRRQVVVDDRAIAELVDLTLGLFTAASRPAFEAHCDRIARCQPPACDLFVATAKRRARSLGRTRPVDFRFTDLRAATPAHVRREVARARRPSPSHLFLFWQLLATTSPRRWSPAQRDAIARLAASVQTTQPDGAAWAAVRAIAAEIAADLDGRPDPALRGAFFLP